LEQSRTLAETASLLRCRQGVSSVAGTHACPRSRFLVHPRSRLAPANVISTLPLHHPPPNRRRPKTLRHPPRRPPHNSTGPDPRPQQPTPRTPPRYKPLQNLITLQIQIWHPGNRIAVLRHLRRQNRAPGSVRRGGEIFGRGVRGAAGAALLGRGMFGEEVAELVGREGRVAVWEEDRGCVCGGEAGGG